MTNTSFINFILTTILIYSLNTKNNIEYTWNNVPISEKNLRDSIENHFIRYVDSVKMSRSKSVGNFLSVVVM
jgi:hypothetical protein